MMGPVKKILISNRKNIIVFLLIFLWIVAFSVWSIRLSDFPVDASLQLSDTGIGIVQQDIYIPLPEKYHLYLLLTDRTVSSRKRIPWRWSLVSKEHQTIAAADEGDKVRPSGWSSRGVYFEIGSLRVDPGVYAFSTEILGDVPDVDFEGARIVMNVSPKAATTWQLKLAWGGMIVNVYVLMPIGFVFIASLAWKMLRARRDS